jgi:DNA-binding transcriptional LysR family regulator
MCISKIHFGNLTMSISNITTAQLRILVAIVDETSFSAAAARIGMTQSGASQAIRVLETALGAKLLLG